MPRCSPPWRIVPWQRRWSRSKAARSPKCRFGSRTAQPFLKVDLPAGASIVSVEVAGEAAKPLIGTDGTRVPLLRPGFRPSGVYTVSFVYLHAGAPFARNGDMQMTLPKMDLPVGLVEWEVFVPDRYFVRRLGGNAIARHPNDGLTVTAGMYGTGSGGGSGSGSGAGIGSVSETVIVSSESPQGRTRDGIVRSPDGNFGTHNSRPQPT